ncbi:MAG: hypothetical protein AB7O56_14525 [Bauldia sp.]
MHHPPIDVRRVMTEPDRKAVLGVLGGTYLREKRWITTVEPLFPASDPGHRAVAWFLATIGDQPVGVTRVSYDPPIEEYRRYGLRFIDPTLDVEDLLRGARVAEIGRLATLAEVRRSWMLPVAMMRAATLETLSRGYTHYVTDILEDDPHSPYRFHTEVLGFRPVATHDTGELLSPSRRITLLLDIRAAYVRMTRRNSAFARFLTKGWEEMLGAEIAA